MQERTLTNKDTQAKAVSPLAWLLPYPVLRRAALLAQQMAEEEFVRDYVGERVISVTMIIALFVSCSMIMILGASRVLFGINEATPGLLLWLVADMVFLYSFYVFLRRRALNAQAHKQQTTRQTRVSRIKTLRSGS